MIRANAAFSRLDCLEIFSSPRGTRPANIRAKAFSRSFLGMRCTLHDIGTTSHWKFCPLLLRNTSSIYASAFAPRLRNGTLYLPFAPLHLPARAAARDRFVSFNIVARVYSNGLLNKVGSRASHCPGTPLSVQTLMSGPIMISCPRKSHTPINVVPDVNSDSGIENPEVPGA